MKQLRNLLIIIVLIAGFQKVFSNPLEINIATSIDWLCYDADLIITGKLTESTSNPNANPITEFQNTNLMNVQVIMKGDLGTNKIRFTTRLPYIGGQQLKNLVGREVIVFLKSVDGKFHAWEDTYSLLPLDKPGNYALTGAFKTLKAKMDIIEYVESTLQKLEGKTAKPYFLEVPVETEAYNVLYSGSSCYLIVPDILYPEAKKSMLD